MTVCCGPTIRATFARLCAAGIGLLLLLALAGLLISLWTHLETFAGVDPGSRGQRYWVLQLVLFILVLPLVLETVAKKRLARIVVSPRWVRMVLSGLFVYYAANFYEFLYWSAEHLNSRATWRMFSSGWLLLFALTAAYYAEVLAVGKRRK